MFEKILDIMDGHVWFVRGPHQQDVRELYDAWVQESDQARQLSIQLEDRDRRLANAEKAAALDQALIGKLQEDLAHKDQEIERLRRDTCAFQQALTATEEQYQLTTSLLDKERANFCTDPDDRLYKAKNNTWWKREFYGGPLVTADITHSINIVYNQFLDQAEKEKGKLKVLLDEVRQHNSSLLNKLDHIKKLAELDS